MHMIDYVKIFLVLACLWCQVQFVSSRTNASVSASVRGTGQTDTTASERRPIGTCIFIWAVAGREGERDRDVERNYRILGCRQPTITVEHHGQLEI